MSDYGCLKEHLPKTLSQTIYQSMVWVFLKNCHSGRVSFGAKAEGQQEDLHFWEILHMRGVGLWKSLSC